MEGGDKRMFIEFVKRMTKWNPDERSTAKELRRDPWLYRSLMKIRITSVVFHLISVTSIGNFSARTQIPLMR